MHLSLIVYSGLVNDRYLKEIRSLDSQKGLPLVRLLLVWLGDCWWDLWWVLVVLGLLILGLVGVWLTLIVAIWRILSVGIPVPIIVSYRLLIVLLRIPINKWLLLLLIVLRILVRLLIKATSLHLSEFNTANYIIIFNHKMLMNAFNSLRRTAMTGGLLRS
jgi:hypothetical protein